MTWPSHPSGEAAYWRLSPSWRQRVADAEARVAELEGALREILGFAENNDEQAINFRFDAIHRIARAALAEQAATEERA